jgi:GNAT superfamily N-acetyltransferase
MRNPSDPSCMYNYVRARQLEGTYSDDCSIGTWVVSSMRVHRGWGIPAESEWPYDTTVWPPEEPAQIDQAAKADRVLAYQRVRTADECKKILAKHAVSAAFEIASGEWRSAPMGHIPMPDPNTKLTDSHTICLLDYDESKSAFKFANSWGEEWGDKGYGLVPYSYFERYQHEAWTHGAGVLCRPKIAGSGIEEQRWGIPDCLSSSPLHGFELFDHDRDECLGWAFIVERQGFADIEELFVRPIYRAKGYGRRLAELIKASPYISDRPLRLWVPHADRDSINAPAFAKVLQRLHLNPRPNRASRRWAAYVAM